MHDWHSFAVWLGILFVIAPALAGGVAGFVFYRRKRGGGAGLQGLIGGAIIGAAAGAGIAVILLRF